LGQGRQENGMPPGEHVFDNGIADFALLFKHFQNFILEGLFQVPMSPSAT
jgi:hypothetical protein